MNKSYETMNIILVIFDPGCVGGIAGAGILGGIIAGVMRLPRQIIRAARRCHAADGEGAE